MSSLEQKDPWRDLRKHHNSSEGKPGQMFKTDYKDDDTSSGEQKASKMKTFPRGEERVRMGY